MYIHKNFMYFFFLCRYFMYFFYVGILRIFLCRYFLFFFIFMYINEKIHHGNSLHIIDNIYTYQIILHFYIFFSKIHNELYMYVLGCVCMERF